MAREIAKVRPSVLLAESLIDVRFLVGDFGLATSSLAAVDPSDVSRPGITMDSEMTLGTFFLYFTLVIVKLTVHFRGWNTAIYCAGGPVS